VPSAYSNLRCLDWSCLVCVPYPGFHCGQRLSQHQTPGMNYQKICVPVLEEWLLVGDCCLLAQRAWMQCHLEALPVPPCCCPVPMHLRSAGGQVQSEPSAPQARERQHLAGAGHGGEQQALQQSSGLSHLGGQHELWVGPAGMLD
jgi:hypothetical protein